jgi:hypothetical protein
MSIISAQNRFSKLLSEAGRAVVHQRFPDEFEYYMIALELVNPATGKTEDLLIFPLMPDEIRIRQPEITEIRKTAAGIAVLNNPTYVPREISINGTFGRKFRILLSDFDIGVSYSYSSNPQVGEKGGKKISGITAEFDGMIKTGYGTTKRLYSLLDKVNQLTPEGVPYQLFLYNSAFNDNNLVELLDKSVSQDMGNNMYWKYSLAFKTTAPATQIRTAPNEGTLQKLLEIDLLQKAAGTALTIAREQSNLLRNKVLGSGPVIALENTVSNFINKF